MRNLIYDYRKRLVHEIDEVTLKNGRGASSWDNYCERLGEIKGLEQALLLFNNAVKRLGEDDD